MTDQRYITCPVCKGCGEIKGRKCERCKGAGVVPVILREVEAKGRKG